MSDEQEALAMVNEAFVECGYDCDDNFNASLKSHRTALRAVKGTALRAVQEHKAFAQEVSDAVEEVLTIVQHHNVDELLSRFIIAKPDPLVEALNDMKDGRAGSTMESYAACLRAALAKHNGRIVFDD